DLHLARPEAAALEDGDVRVALRHRAAAAAARAAASAGAARAARAAETAARPAGAAEAPGPCAALALRRLGESDVRGYEARQSRCDQCRRDFQGGIPL